MPRLFRSLTLDRGPGHLLRAGCRIIRLICPCVAEYGDRLVERSQDGAGDKGSGKRVDIDGANMPKGSRCLVLEAGRERVRTVQPCSAAQRPTVEVIHTIRVATAFLMK